MEKVIKKVGITGSNGFLGRHASWFFSTKKDEIEIVPIHISDINNPKELEKLVNGLDVLLHFARIHPLDVSNPEDVYAGNLSLAKKVLEALDTLDTKPYLIFSSSTQITKDNPYGRAKKDIGIMFREWGEKNKTDVTNLVIPNEFGESATPGRISVVSTFCEDLLAGRESKVAEGVLIPLIHAQDVIKEIFELINSPKSEDVYLKGTEMSISDLYDNLKRYKDLYVADIMPELPTPLHVSLFNNLRWHIFSSGFYPRKIILRSDERGTLFEVIKEHTGGQTFTSSTKPGVTRGNHFHTRKIERFCVIKGHAEIGLRQVGKEEVFRFKVSGDDPVYIDMPTFFTHNITNIGSEELLTIFWSHEIFDPLDPDTYYLTV